MKGIANPSVVSLAICIAFTAIAVPACNGATSTVDHPGLSDADRRAFKVMFFLSKSDIGRLELTPAGQAFVDAKGNLLTDRTDPRWVYRNRAFTLIRAHYELKSDPKAAPRFAAAEQEILDAIPDGANAVYGHRKAFDILDERGLLREIVDKAPYIMAFDELSQDVRFKPRIDEATKRILDAVPGGANALSGPLPVFRIVEEAGLQREAADRAMTLASQHPENIAIPADVLEDPNDWGYPSDSMRLNGHLVWAGSSSVLQFHCCGGHVRTTWLSGELEQYSKAHQWLFENDAPYKAQFLQIVRPLEAEVVTLPFTGAGQDRCDAITTEVRTKLQDAHVTDRIEAQARLTKSP